MGRRGGILVVGVVAAGVAAAGLGGCAATVPVKRYEAVARTLEEATAKLKACMEAKERCQQERDRLGGMLQTCMDEDVRGKEQLARVRERWSLDAQALEACRRERDRLAAAEEGLRERVARAEGESEAWRKKARECAEAREAQEAEASAEVKRLEEELSACGRVRDEQEEQLVALKASEELWRKRAEGCTRRDEARAAKEDYAKRWARWFLENARGVPGVRAVEVGGDEVLITLGVDELFVRGRAVVSREGGRILGSLAPLLAQWPGRWEAEGHSDALPVGALLEEWYPSNWELSAARAAGVVRVLVHGYGLDGKRWRAVGFGASRPVVWPEKRPEDRARNRRVVLRATGLVWEGEAQGGALEKAAPPGGGGKKGEDEGEGPGEKS